MKPDADTELAHTIRNVLTWEMEISDQQVKRLMPLANYFNTATLKLVSDGKLFT